MESRREPLSRGLVRRPPGRWARLGLIVASVLLYAASFPPLSLWPCAWLALAPLFVAIAGGGAGRGFQSGVLWGVLAAYACGWALPSMVSDYFGLPLLVGWAVFGFVAVFLAGIWFGVFGAWLGFVSGRSSVGPLPVAGAWTAAELARASVLVGDPWAMLAYAQPDGSVWTQAADLGGPYAVTALTVLGSGLAAALVAPRLRGGRPALAAGLALVTLIVGGGYGQWRLGQDFSIGEPVRFGLVQSGLARAYHWRPEHRRFGLDRHLGLSRALAAENPDVIVWPENAVSFYLEEDHAETREVLALSEELGAELVLGGPSYRYGPDGPRYRNSVYLVRDGRRAGRYDKLRLLPLAEDDVLMGWFPREQPFEPGQKPRALRSGHGLFAVFVCFEAMYPELVREIVGRTAGIMINVSNDDWFGRAPFARHHLQMAALRAVEHRRPLVRVTTTGMSAFVDAHGRIAQPTPFGTQATLTADVTPAAAETPYRTHGDLFAYLCLASTLAIATPRPPRISRKRG